MDSRKLRWSAVGFGGLGVILTGILHWQVFFWVPTESTMGIVQRIFYIHVPGMWVGLYLAMGIVTLASIFYLWLGDERLDMAALAAAEGGMVFLTVGLVTGPLWARIAWGTWWTWEPRLTLTLLLWFIYLGYFLVRSSAESPERGRKFAAVVAIVAAIDLPLIHLSVVWFRSLHPEPVVVTPDGPSLHPDMLATLMTGLGAFTFLFVGLFLFRYGVEAVRRRTAMVEAGRAA
ncbi:MAG: cytochrome c biogenesis protein CcsA [Gemmatimonadota bacterium]